jgi:hypothetical protein
MDHLQTRDIRGADVRRQIRHADVVRILREARLPATQRGVVVDYLGTARIHDERDDLGGARYLRRAAEDMPNIGNLRATVRRLATAFVHPAHER